MSKHTPGPWAVYPETDGTEIWAVDLSPGLPVRQPICVISRSDNWLANGRLVAVAPEMYEALKNALNYFEGKPSLAVMATCRAAIAKAEGNP